MKLRTDIAYRAQWGEQIVLCAGGKRFPMTCEDGCRWVAETDDIDYGSCGYHSYELVRDGNVLRREYRPHRLIVHGNVTQLTVHDSWNDIPEDAPLYSVAFTHGIFGRRETKSHAMKQGNVEFVIPVPDLRPHEILAMAGSGGEMGDWKVFHRFDDLYFPYLRLELNVTGRFSYKFLILDAVSGGVVMWEDGCDRFLSDVPGDGERIVFSGIRPVFGREKYRGAGTAIPVFSLRTETGFGSGEFMDLKKMVDWAVMTGQGILQLLPVNDTGMTGTWTDSYPYNANSSFALHPQFVSLVEAGLVEDERYVALRDELNSLPQVDYERVNALKTAYMRELYRRDAVRISSREDYVRFIDDNRHWLMPYAAFCVMRDVNGTADFTRWGEAAVYSPGVLSDILEKYADEAGFHCFVQYHLDRQLSEVCRYAHSRGVVLKGDLPIGISRTSVDAWCFPELFHMDSQAGAPPDAFSASGQNWGFPTYNWERMAQDGYAWWKSRMAQMQKYFDAFRIDHILGFFRIWEIPEDAVSGILGHFSPALPYAASELEEMGFDVERYSVPPVDDSALDVTLGDVADEVRLRCMEDGHIAPDYAVQRKIMENVMADDAASVRLADGLMHLAEEVLFLEDPRRKGSFHPAIGGRGTYAYRSLDEGLRRVYDGLYDDFFYRRHNGFWKESALEKLPALLDSTGMLACGEDLGMIPATVPEVMERLRILSLEIQRMPKAVGLLFADPASYPYLSVCTTSTHDMNPLRAWWEEDREMTQKFYNTVLGEEGQAPVHCEPWICERILRQHLDSPSMFVILPLQDWLSMDGSIRLEDPGMERINVPANPRHYWRYRMHLTVEDLIACDSFNARVRSLVCDGGRYCDGRG